MSIVAICSEADQGPHVERDIFYIGSGVGEHGVEGDVSTDIEFIIGDELIFIVDAKG